MIKIKNENYETQKDEIELLKNILFEQIEIFDEFPYDFEITIKPDIIETPVLILKMKISFTEEYPNSEPKFEIYDDSNYLASNKIKIINENVKIFIQENIGFAMIYQIYELVKDFANEQEDLISKAIISKTTLEDENRKKKEKFLENYHDNLVETKSFTPVTREKYEEWFTKFYSKSKSKSKIEQESRLSGREYFMNIKNQKNVEFEDDGKEEPEINNEQENAFFYDADAFEENIDDIDFDKEDELENL